LEELTNLTISKTDLPATVEDLKQRLEAIRAIYLPLLMKLNEKSEVPYIKWPNRKAILDEQINKLKQLTDV
jgi:hypothetical protein